MAWLPVGRTQPCNIRFDGLRESNALRHGHQKANGQEQRFHEALYFVGHLSGHAATVISMGMIGENTLLGFRADDVALWSSEPDTNAGILANRLAGRCSPRLGGLLQVGLKKMLVKGGNDDRYLTTSRNSGR